MGLIDPDVNYEKGRTAAFFWKVLDCGRKALKSREVLGLLSQCSIEWMFSI
jgi:hypothetical protein